ncbi:hypothetical protein COB55_01580 [Candidatus Wolfebacteria bacterium]|nr:MAG: hypothetical protein COB55_01580 [Candidatus Wolfebacteria bacterium]
MFARKRKRKVSKTRLEQRRKTIVLIGVGIFAAVLILIGLFAWITNTERLSVVDIYISGNKVVAREDIRDLVESELEGSYLKIFARENIIIYPKDDIVASIYDAYSRIKNVEVSRDGLHSLNISIYEYEPFALWCGGLIDEYRESEESCYFFDAKGYLFDRAPDFSGDAFIRYYGAISTSTEPLRKSFLTPEKVAHVADFLGLLETLFFEPISFLVTAENDYVVTMKNNVSILIAPDSDLLEVLENLQSVVSSEKFADALSDSSSILEYIDMRFDNKVFYKFAE